MNTKEKNKLIKLKILAVIPARMGSSRFPGKPLVKINSIPMIQHVYKNVKVELSLELSLYFYPLL